MQFVKTTSEESLRKRANFNTGSGFEGTDRNAGGRDKSGWNGNNQKSSSGTNSKIESNTSRRKSTIPKPPEIESVYGPKHVSSSSASFDEPENSKSAQISLDPKYTLQNARSSANRTMPIDNRKGNEKSCNKDVRVYIPLSIYIYIYAILLPNGWTDFV